ncbi:hypothetical protein HYS96_04720 [Candidatus Daviesbacteria bacterium]|nr:hypothetical protein [Candidatus Daviesbacteria bacterium]
MEKIKIWFAAHKVTAILAVLIILILSAALFTFQKIISKPAGSVEEVDLIFDAEGPYAQIFPRKDGNALILRLTRTSSYDAISYELAYTSKVLETAIQGGRVLDGGESADSASSLQVDLGNSGTIDRGVIGTINVSEKKGEYEQEILFGTCSKNICKYDKGVENGTLTLHIVRVSFGGKKKAYRMVTQWHLQKPDVALGQLTSGDGHFIYMLDADRQTLANVGFSIVNDLTGVPKLPPGKEVLGKVYSLNVPIAKQLPSGSISLELVENPQEGAKLYSHNGSDWKELDTKIDGSKLSAKADGAGIFAVLIPRK